MKKFSLIFLTLMTCLLLVACGGPQRVTDKQMTLNFSFGERTGIYTGEVNEQGLPNGQGKFASKSPEGIVWTHEGEFKNGHIDGQGTHTWPDLGEKITGSFVNDEINGQGKFYRNNVLIYEGEYVDGKENGQGKIYNNNQVVYEGRFENNLPMLEAVEQNTDVSYADWVYKVTNSQAVNTIGNKQANGQYLIVTIDATNNGNSQRQIGSGDFFVLVDSEGRVFNMDNMASWEQHGTTNYQGPWYLSEINPGLSMQGIPLVFDVPKDIEGAKLVPAQAFGKVTPIKVQ